MPSSDPGDEARRSHLRVQAISIPVKDLDRSLAFYEQALGFRTVHRGRTPAGAGFAIVAPPDGHAMLLLSEEDPAQRMGTASGILFVTDDIERRHREWLERGVSFQHSPTLIGFGALHATFIDPDGNSFQVVEADVVTRQIEAERQRAEDRAERERRAEYEMQVATQVQAGLLPRQRPAMSTLEYTGICLQARQVGGDYFDFLDYGRGRLGLVIGDVSGKGLGAALLMANLQAHIRSRYSLYPADLPSLLRSVNELFKGSTPAASYASLFFGIYDDHTRQLTYVNCGHPPALVLRPDGGVNWLEATGYALGMFDEWSGSAVMLDLASGDTFVLYTDGVTEALDQHGHEFGAAEAAAVCRAATGGVDAVLNDLVTAVRAFSGDRQHDDITIVTARALGGPRS